MKRVILASASPRRSMLLKQIGLEFDIIHSNLEEKIDSSISPEELAKDLAYRKALSVSQEIEMPSLVIGADTIVVKGDVLGKPQSEDEAYKMLKSLQGEWHDVITGITVIEVPEMKYKSSYEKTRVKMRELNNNTINSYIKSGEPMDKAGAYGIQGLGAVLVEKIEGCYFNVVGLPLTRLSIVLEDFGVKVLG